MICNIDHSQNTSRWLKINGLIRAAQLCTTFGINASIIPAGRDLHLAGTEVHNCLSHVPYVSVQMMCCYKWHTSSGENTPYWTGSNLPSSVFPELVWFCFKVAVGKRQILHATNQKAKINPNFSDTMHHTMEQVYLTSQTHCKPNTCKQVMSTVRQN